MSRKRGTLVWRCVRVSTQGCGKQRKKDGKKTREIKARWSPSLVATPFDVTTRSIIKTKKNVKLPTNPKPSDQRIKRDICRGWHLHLIVGRLPRTLMKRALCRLKNKRAMLPLRLSCPKYGCKRGGSSAQLQPWIPWFFVSLRISISMPPRFKSVSPRNVEPDHHGG